MKYAGCMAATHIFHVACGRPRAKNSNVPMNMRLLQKQTFNLLYRAPAYRLKYNVNIIQASSWLPRLFFVSQECVFAIVTPFIWRGAYSDTLIRSHIFSFYFKSHIPTSTSMLWVLVAYLAMRPSDIAAITTPSFACVLYLPWSHVVCGTGEV